MKKYIFLILLLNINISYGGTQLGFKNLIEYCHYFNPQYDAILIRSQWPRKAHCTNKLGEIMQTVICCNKDKTFWIKISPTDTKCPMQGAMLSDSCGGNTGVY